MVTISTIHSGPFTLKTCTQSKSMQRVDVQLDNGYATCNCPICNKKIVVTLDAIIIDECEHYVFIQGNNPFWHLFFDKEECTIFKFDEIQDAVLRMPHEFGRNKIVKRLNSSKYVEAISTEWEVVIMSWLNKLGHLEYEKPNSKGRNPDIFWESFGKEVQFSADIKTVFDQFDRDYPAAEFCREASTVIAKYIPSTWACDTQFRNKGRGVPKIFPKPRFAKNLAALEAEIQQMQHNFTCGEAYTFTVEGHNISFFLREADGYRSSGFQSKYYDQYDKNPIYNGLIDKSDQLVKDGDELLGIFLCDGGTETINPALRNICAASINEILDNFFNEEEKIDFVATFGISQPPVSTFRFDFYINTYKEINNDTQRLKAFLESNALHLMKHQDCPKHVQQKITHTKEGVRKIFCSDKAQ